MYYQLSVGRLRDARVGVAEVVREGAVVPAALDDQLAGPGDRGGGGRALDHKTDDETVKIKREKKFLVK
jgi:hypothetical protein